MGIGVDGMGIRVDGMGIGVDGMGIRYDVKGTIRPRRGGSGSFAAFGLLMGGGGRQSSGHLRSETSVPSKLWA
eukprot:1180186-Prorocentrum_minimum.AAC.2